MERQAYFERMAMGGAAPMAFKAEHLPRVARLRERLGNLCGWRVLEPGCGGGALTEHLAEWTGPEGRVVAFDSSAAMMARFGEERRRSRGVYPVCMKAENAWFAAGTFDLILCFRFYPHLTAPGEFVAKCRKWLRVGGALVVANLEGSAELNAFHARMPGVRGDVMPGVVELRRSFEEWGWRVTEAIDTPEEYFLRAEPVSSSVAPRGTRRDVVGD